MQRCDNCSRIWRDAAGRWICNKSLVSLLRQNERLDFALLERVFLYKGERKFSPAYFERLPISSPILRSWLYFASLSDRHGAPVLICPVCNPTTRSAHEKIKKNTPTWNESFIVSTFRSQFPSSRNKDVEE